MCSLTGGRARRGGFTLIELVITVVILPIFLISAALVATSSKEAFGTARGVAELQSSLDRAVSRVAAEMLCTSRDVLVPDPSTDRGSGAPVFRKPVGLTVDTVDWGTRVCVGFEYQAGELDDGLDNNGNGLVDEGVLVLTRNLGEANERRVILCHGVSERGEGEILNGVDDNGNGVVDESGFNVHRVDDVLTIRLTLEATDSSGNRVQRSIATALHFRN